MFQVEIPRCIVCIVMFHDTALFIMFRKAEPFKTFSCRKVEKLGRTLMQKNDVRDMQHLDYTHRRRLYCCQEEGQGYTIDGCG